ncbi:MAG: peroxiredoxin [Acidimicrobiales bacterium]|jgi:peroxiredoxin Q/BCP
MRIGEVVPDFTLSDQFGESRTLSTLLSDGPIALFFYPAAMTTGCTRECRNFRDLAGDFKALGAQRIGISMDSVERQSQFTEKNQLDYPLLADVDGTVARLFGVKRTLDVLKVKRSTFVIARDRRVVDVIHSETNMNAHASRALEALRALG